MEGVERNRGEPNELEHAEQAGIYVYLYIYKYIFTCIYVYIYITLQG